MDHIISQYIIHTLLIRSIVNLSEKIISVSSARGGLRADFASKIGRIFGLKPRLSPVEMENEGFFEQHLTKGGGGSNLALLRCSLRKRLGSLSRGDW